MDFEIKKIDPVEDKRWDIFINNHPNGWLCSHSHWKIILENSFHHIKGNFYLVIDKSNAEIKGVIPLYEVCSRFTGRRLVSVPFATINDLLFDDDICNKSVFKHIQQLVDNNNVQYVKIISFFSKNNQFFSHFSNDDEYLNHQLKLKDPDRLIKDIFHSSVRKGINIAEKFNISICKGRDFQDVKDFYSLYLISRKRLGLPPQPFRFFINLFNVLTPHDQLTLLVAKLNGKVVGGIILLKFKDRISADYLASDINYRKLKLDTYLYWNAIKLAWEEGYKFFDFGRTAKSNTGLIMYKDKWGTERNNISHYYYPTEPTRRNKKSLSYKIINITCKFAPQFILLILGNFIYNHMD